MKRSISIVLALILLVSLCFSSSTQVFALEESVLAARGTTYGPWDGDSTYNYNNAVDPLVDVLQIMLPIVSSALGMSTDSNQVRLLAGGVAAAANKFFGLENDAEYIEGTVKKQYREVYVNGEFAYFQSKYTVTAYAVAPNGTRTRLSGSPFTEYYEGPYPMILKPE